MNTSQEFQCRLMTDSDAAASVVGWNTSVGSLPKKHTIQYAAAALEKSSKQALIYLDKLFPVAQKTVLPTMARNHALAYEAALRVLANKIESEIAFVHSEAEISCEELFRFTRSITIQQLLKALPPSLDVSQISVKELLHPVFEYIAWEKLIFFGAKSIITNASRPSLPLAYPGKLSLIPINARASTSPQVEEVWSLLQEAALIKSQSEAGQNYVLPCEHILELCEPIRKEIAKMYGGKPYALFLTGSASQGIPDPNDIDLIVISEEILPLNGYCMASEEISKRYAGRSVDTVALKTSSGSTCVSIRFIHPDVLSSYYSGKPLKQWRQQALNRTTSNYQTVAGQPVLVPVNQCTESGGFSRTKSTLLNGTPIIETNFTMILTGLLLDDSGGYSIMPLLLLTQLEQVGHGYARMAAERISERTKIHPKTIQKVFAQSIVASCAI